MDAWGWDEGWTERASGFVGRVTDDGATVGRVTAQERDRWTLRTQEVEVGARLPGPHALPTQPVVGDWVVARPGPAPSDPWSIVAVLPRRTALSRGAAGSGAREQVLAANVDRIWVVHGLDRPVNPRAMERYLAMAWESGAVPEVVLTKADLVEDVSAALLEIGRAAVGVRVRVVSGTDVASVDQLLATLAPGQTVVLVGPSGVGKSTLVNALAGTDLTATGQVRAGDRKGRHTTTRRALFRVRGGALLLDTPGIRELRVWDLDEGLSRAFPDVDDLARGCRFRDCRHESEPGCAVLLAEAEGRLDPDRLASFRTLQAEAAYQARRSDARARKAAVAEHKTALKTLRFHTKRQDRG